MVHRVNGRGEGDRPQTFGDLGTERRTSRTDLARSTSVEVARADPYQWFPHWPRRIRGPRADGRGVRGARAHEALVVRRVDGDARAHHGRLGLGELALAQQAPLVVDVLLVAVAAAVEEDVARVGADVEERREELGAVDRAVAVLVEEVDGRAELRGAQLDVEPASNSTST